jgi:hypothetical protein
LGGNASTGDNPEDRRGALIKDGKAFASLAMASLGGLGFMLLLIFCAGRLFE